MTQNINCINNAYNCQQNVNNICVLVYLFGKLLLTKLVEREELASQDDVLDEPDRGQLDPDDDLAVRHHHGHRTEVDLQVLGQFLAASVARVLGRHTKWLQSTQHVQTYNSEGWCLSFADKYIALMLIKIPVHFHLQESIIDGHLDAFKSKMKATAFKMAQNPVVMDSFICFILLNSKMSIRCDNLTEVKLVF